MNTITAEKRDASVKAKQLRRSGIVPCAVYGGLLPESLSIQTTQSDARQLLRSNREGSKIEIRLDGQSIPALIKEAERNLTTGEVVHMSFQALDPDRRINSKSHIVLKNKDTVPGTLEQMLFEVSYSALPADVIGTVTVDLADLKVGTILTVGDIPAFKSEKIELQAGADSIVLRIRDRKRSSDPIAE